MILCIQLEFMKRDLLLSVPASFMLLAGICGCTDDVVLDGSLTEDGRERTEEPETRAGVLSGNAVYHEETGLWLRPSPDPYTLENFQKAYDNLSSGRSALSFGEAAAGKFPKMRLKATHYAVRIFPKTSAELRELELSEDVDVSYTPFDHVQLSADESKDMQAASSQTYSEESRYYVTYDGYKTSDGEEEPFAVPLPVLYAVWPCDKPFPAGMDCETLYEVFLPRRSLTKIAGLTPGAMELLESEAINIASPVQTRGSEPVTKFVRAEGSVFTEDWR